MRLKANMKDKHPAGAEMPPEKPCAVRLSEGKSVTSVAVFPDTYAPLLRSAYGGLLRHNAVSSTPVFRQLGTACRIVCGEWLVFARIRLPTLHLPAGQTCGNICIVRCWQSRFPTLDSHSSSQALYHSFPCKHEKLVHSAAPPLPKKSYDFPGTPITQAAVLFVIIGTVGPAF